MGSLHTLVSLGLVVLSTTFGACQNTTSSATTDNITTLGSTITTGNSTGSAPSITSGAVSTASVITQNISTSVPITTVTTAHVTTEDFTPHFSILPANKTSTIRSTHGPPSSTTKPGFDGASFGGGIGAGMGIFLLLLFFGILIVTMRRKMQGPNYEVL
ncbi:uncharacterized protein LOC128182908 [Crassostrea angulata]|uniref:uncharacterized protein LOC128182908 n=1 Tax=Magallana angulata TaxID=2784310 RepID=UPI0022B1036C|nr:uncharacterized protein LOC128182908 [Crassostrea angulata]